MELIDVGNFLERVGNWMLTSGIQIVLILVIMFAALKGSALVSDRLLTFILRRRTRKTDAEFQKRADTLKSVVRYLLTVIVLAVGLMMLLGEIGIEIGPMIAAAGVVGVAVGFGAQNVVQDLLAGFFIFLEDQIRVGDVVEVAGKSGVVEQVNLRMTILRDLAGNVHYIRNGQIDVVTNMTKDFSHYVFDIGVAYREDVDAVMDVIREVDEALREDPDFAKDILAPIEILGLDRFAESAVVIKARTKTQPIQQWRVGREFNRRLKKRFDELDIEIPYPHVTLYMGADKRGGAPPMHVQLADAGSPPPARLEEAT